LSVLSAIREEAEPIINGMGFKIVEIKLGLSHKLNHISIVIYSKTGVGVNDCSSVSKNILPRLELIDGLDNISLEITSPGINRQIKSKEEYNIFVEKGIKLLLNNSTDWIGGIIKETRENILFLSTEKGIIEINMENIKKAKLDYSQEDR